MTEYWKSNPMHWCDICKVWMQDTKAAKLNHERGFKHQELLAKKLREMGDKQKADKKEQETAAKTMSEVEAKAKKQYEEDMAAAKQLRGTWVKQADTGYFYNAQHRWYYDPKTKFYYGGEPPEWTQKPSLPEVALYDWEQRQAAAHAATGSASTSSRSSGGEVRVAIRSVSELTKSSVPAHPLANIGGYQMPVEGRIGGAKGVGVTTSKRKREEGGEGGGWGRKLDPKEEEELRQREAARARVAARTKAAFGLS